MREPIKKKLDGRECMMYGVSANLYEWTRESPLVRNEFSKELNEASLCRALGHPSPDERQTESKQLIKTLWARYPELGPYFYLDTLSKMEFENTFHTNYRTHVSHLLKVFLLGLYLYEKCSKLQIAILNEIDNVDEGEAEAEFLRRWTAAALFHDIGYILENDCAKDPADPIWKKLCKNISEAFETMLSNVTEGHDNGLDPEMEKEAAENINLRAFTVEGPGALTTRIAKFFDRIEEYGFKAGLAENPESMPFRTVYNIGQNSLPAEGRPSFQDHGITSALLLILTWKEFGARLKAFAESDDVVGVHIGKSRFGHLRDLHSKLQGIEETVNSAAGAMALHNLRRDTWPADATSGRGLTLKALSVRLYPRKNDAASRSTPLAFLLCLADALQDWDRCRFREPRTDDYNLLDQDMLITPSRRRVALFFQKDYDEFIDPGKIKYAIYHKAREELKQILDKDEVDALVEWDQRWPSKAHASEGEPHTSSARLCEPRNSDSGLPVGDWVGKLGEAVRNHQFIPVVGPRVLLDDRFNGSEQLQILRRVETIAEILEDENQVACKSFLWTLLADKIKKKEVMTESDNGLTPGILEKFQATLVTLSFEISRIFGDAMSVGKLNVINIRTFSLCIPIGQFQECQRAFREVNVAFRELEEVPGDDFELLRIPRIRGYIRELQSEFTQVDTEIALGAWHLEAVAELLWYTLHYDRPAYPTDEELAFVLKLLATGRERISMNVSAPLAHGVQTVHIIEFLKRRCQHDKSRAARSNHCTQLQFHRTLAEYLYGAFETLQDKANKDNDRGPDQSIVLAIKTTFDDELESALENQFPKRTFHVVLPIVSQDHKLRWLVRTRAEGKWLWESPWLLQPQHGDSQEDNPIKRDFETWRTFQGPIIIKVHGDPTVDLPSGPSHCKNRQDWKEFPEDMEHYLVISEERFFANIFDEDRFPSALRHILMRSEYAVFSIGDRLTSTHNRLRLFQHIRLEPTQTHFVIHPSNRIPLDAISRYRGEAAAKANADIRNEVVDTTLDRFVEKLKLALQARRS